MRRLASRPCWVVLAPGGRSEIELAVSSLYDRAGEPCAWQIVDGNAGYLAVVEHEPGSEGAGDDLLAKALSRTATRPVYVLWLDDEIPRVQAFISGAYAGEVAAWPDDVAAQLGCSFDGMNVGSTDPVDLTPEMPLPAKPGERKIAGWTVAQWGQQMKHCDWSVLLDGAGAKSVREAIDALEDVDRAVRLVACKLIGALDVHRLRGQARRALTALATRAEDDPDEKVRSAATEARDDLRESIEREEVREELPWIVNYHPDALSVAVATLDDPRLAVRRELYLWWMGARQLPAAVRRQAIEKLESLVTRETDPLAMRLAQSALQRVRG